MGFGRMLTELACCGMRPARMPAYHGGLSSPGMVAMEFYMTKIIMNKKSAFVPRFYGKEAIGDDAFPSESERISHGMDAAVRGRLTGSADLAAWRGTIMR